MEEPENMPNEKPNTKDHVLYDSIYEMSRTGKYIQTESRLSLARGQRDMETGSDCEWVQRYF